MHVGAMCRSALMSAWLMSRAMLSVSVKLNSWSHEFGGSSWRCTAGNWSLVFNLLRGSHSAGAAEGLKFDSRDMYRVMHRKMGMQPQSKFSPDVVYYQLLALPCDGSW